MNADLRAGRRRDLRRGMLAGTLATLLMLVAVVLLRRLTGIVSLLDAAAEVTLSWMPMRLFSALLRLFGTTAKGWLLTGIFAGYVVAGALIGRSFARGTAGSRRFKWTRGITTALIVYAVLAVFLLWAASIRTGGALGSLRAVWALLLLLAAVLLFGVALPVALALLRRTDPAPDAPSDAAPDLSRRRLLTRTGLGAVGLAAVAILGREVGRVRSDERVLGGEPGEPPDPITTNNDFYVISKNFDDPGVAGDGWTIRVDGLVEESLRLGLADLEPMAGPDFVSTLNCISNPIGGSLISTARWTGAPLSRILEVAGVRSGVIDVVFHGRDGYTDSIPLEKALAPWTTLVWRMNGDELPGSHGHPARIIVPGRYGIKNVKWVERIELVDRDYQGYWQRQDWTDVGVVKTMSRIDAPAQKAILPAADAELAGIAFAGDRGISKVEVSTDDGETWQEAAIAANPSDVGLSWVIWRLPWSPTPGAYTLLVRATDGDGALQTTERASTLPDGASGLHKVIAGIV